MPGSDTEPDYRFTLANERTFLAWMRTALGLLAGGVAAHQLVPGDDTAKKTLATLCVALAAMVAVAGYPRWRRVQRAMRRGEPLPRSLMTLVLTCGMVVITVLAAILVLAG
ncbi:YidH family protein [Amycolatopsis sp. cg5]|uniref:YidH family protein n=1 Tax=Amycolatopsis sp. cg5 TaxID=3238802 RepID=UPI003525C038